MIDLKVIYKRLVKKKKRFFENNKIKELERLRHAKPRDFWKMFNKRKNSVSNIPLKDFFDYFSKMHVVFNYRAVKILFKNRYQALTTPHLSEG